MAAAGVHTTLSVYFSPPPPLHISLKGHRFSNVPISGPRFAPAACNRSGRKPSAGSKFRAVFRRSKGNDLREEAFVDQNGVVEDMDAYPDHLSPEYASVWDTKPSWCQPWTITTTGIVAITGSWLVLHSPIATLVVLALVSTWWYTFLYSYPKAYASMVAKRKERVTNGLEDTYGSKKSGL
ncbi:hypothetical protein DM860_012635 [Cuscuta australis]|uniref:DUF6737 domain-containing protein n=1 Tax=Cuscuta australis TaxID=267555 RepID=A0A328DD70_9ASTE|nr:hypothetical protein DM860_012635 [Cuscuta australis]